MYKTPRALYGMPPTPHSARSAGTLSRTHSQTSNMSSTMPSVEPFSFQLSQRNASLTSRGNLTPKSSRGDVGSPRWSNAAELPAWQTQGSAMKVYVRVRPFSQREMAHKSPAHSTVRIDEENPSLITLLDPNRDFRPTITFSFTRCFWSVFDSCNALAATRTNNAMDSSNNDSHYNNATINNNNNSIVSCSNSNNTYSRHGSRYTGSGSGAVVTEEAGVTHPPYAGQEEVYQHVGQPILENTLDGYNGCVFAYGQTGSGKTFTMMGCAAPRATEPRTARSRRESLTRQASLSHSAVTTTTTTTNCPTPHSVSTTCGAAAAGSNVSMHQADPTSLCESRLPSPLATLERQGSEDDGGDVVITAHMDPSSLHGIIPRLSAQLFAALRHKRDADPSCSSRVEVMYYEIYNEKVFDLIRPQRQTTELKIRHHPTSGPYVDGLTSKVIVSEEDVMRVLRRGVQERHTAATLFNDHSSRSHAILSFDIVQVHLDGSDNTCTMRSKLNLVDLAGSERTGAAGAAGHEFTDGIKINLSLTVLGRVIDCLADLSQNKSLAVPVPYRESNLTWLLCDSLGGNSQTSMIATVSPHMINFDEMRQTLRYASRAKQIVNRAVRNEDPQVRQIKLLMTEVERLQKLLTESGSTSSSSNYSSEYVEELRRRVQTLESRLTERECTLVRLRAELEYVEKSTIVAAGGAASAAAAGEGQESQQQTPVPVVPPLCIGGKTLLQWSEGVATVPGDAEVGVLQEKLRSADLQISTMRTLLEKHASSESGVVKSLNEMRKIATERASALLSHSRLSAVMLKGYDVTLLRLLDPCFALVQQKESMLIKVMHDLHQSVLASVERAGQTQRRSHRIEMDSLSEQHTAEMSAMMTAHAQQNVRAAMDWCLEEQQQRSAQHQCEWDNFVAATRQLIEEQRVLQEHESAAAMQRMRESHAQELHLLREHAEAQMRQRDICHQQRMRELGEGHAQELQQREAQWQAEERRRDEELRMQRNAFESEAERWGVELTAQEQLRRTAESELGELREELASVRAASAASAERHAGQIGQMARQHEEIIRAAQALVGEWEHRAVDKEVQLHKLRALIYDNDYVQFRQKLREEQFVAKGDVTRMQTQMSRYEEDNRTRLMDIISRARRVQQLQKNNLHVLQSQLLERLNGLNSSSSMAYVGCDTIRHVESCASVQMETSSA